jgi:tetraacyldisaccharide 4'-kinase
LSQARVGAYQRRWVSSLTLKTPVVSLGNLTVGGTGKTPMADLVISYYEKHQKVVGVVSRSYKAEAQRPQRVDLAKSNAARIYGDEPLWLAQHHPEAIVYVGPQKWRTARVLETLEKIDVILVDDGYQHLRLNRQLNVLLIDLSQPISHYQVLPVGRAREAFSEFKRADFVILTKVQSRNLETEKWLKAQGLFRKPHALVKQKLGDLRRLRVEKPPENLNFRLMVDPDKPMRLLVVCALADPKSFLDLLRNRFPQIQFESVLFADHYQYSGRDIDSIESQQKIHSCQGIVTTEKDEVKLRGFSKCASWIVAPLEIEFEHGEREFYECLRQVCH